MGAAEAGLMAVTNTSGPDQGAVLHHGNPVAEQRAMVQGRAVVDRGHHQVVTFTGPDRLVLLHALTSQAFEGLTVGTPTTALVLSPQGHVESGLEGVDDGETFWAITAVSYTHLTLPTTPYV